VPRDRYSLTMSFWVVPRNSALPTPCSSAFATYKASSHDAVALIVIEVFICPGGMPSSRVRMWPRWTTGTPTLPTSPRASSESGSYPVWVGRSKAIDRPVCPFARLVRYSSFDACAVEWPEYVRIIHGRSRSGRSLMSKVLPTGAQDCLPTGRYQIVRPTRRFTNFVKGTSRRHLGQTVGTQSRCRWVAAHRHRVFFGPDVTRSRRPAAPGTPPC
jgi:hypothetical protein